MKKLIILFSLFLSLCVNAQSLSNLNVFENIIIEKFDGIEIASGETSKSYYVNVYLREKYTFLDVMVKIKEITVAHLDYEVTSDWKFINNNWNYIYYKDQSGYIYTVMYSETYNMFRIDIEKPKVKTIKKYKK